jgi:hypothetical protein
MIEIHFHNKPIAEMTELERLETMTEDEQFDYWISKGFAPEEICVHPKFEDSVCTSCGWDSFDAWESEK